MENGRFEFLTSPCWGLTGNVRCCTSQAYWKAHSELPISVNWTFFARCCGWGPTSEYRFKIGDFAPTGAG